MLLGMIRLLARLVERRWGTAPGAVDSFLHSTPTTCLSTRNGVRRITSLDSDPVPTCTLTPASTAADQGSWPESVAPSLRQLWAELAQRHIRTCLIQEEKYDGF
jgi:hypothetical protein